MGRFKVILFVSFTFYNFYPISAAQTKKCANPECDEVLFQGKVHREQLSSHANFLDYKLGDVIKVYAIELNDRVDLWEGELETGTRGLFYKNHIDHDEYLNFLEKFVTENRDLYVVEREKKIGSNVTVEKAAQSLARVWKVIQDKLRQPSVDNLATNGQTTPPPVPTTLPTKDLHGLLKHEHAHGHSHGGHSHSHGGHGHSHKQVDVVDDVVGVAEIKNGLGSHPEPGQIQKEQVHGNSESGKGQKEQVHVNPEPGQGQKEQVHVNPELGQIHGNPESGQGQKEQVHVNPEPGQGQKEQVHVNPVPDQGQKEHVHVNPEPGQGQKEQVHVNPVPGQGQKEQIHGHPETGQIQNEQVHGHADPGQGQSHPEPVQGQKEQVQGYPEPPGHDQGHLEPGQGQKEQVRGNPEPGQGQKEQVRGNLEPGQIQKEQIPEPTQGQTDQVHGHPESDQIQKEQVHDNPEPGQSHPQPGKGQSYPVNGQGQNQTEPGQDQSHPDPGHVQNQTESGTDQGHPDAGPHQGHPGSDQSQKEIVHGHEHKQVDDVTGDGSAVVDVGTEIKNELGDEFCIREDCVPSGLPKKVVASVEIPLESHPEAGHGQKEHVHGHIEPQHNNHGHSHDAHDHSHDAHDHSHDAHDHSHDAHDHSHDAHGHGHSHSHEPTVGEKLADVAKTSKNYAVWIKQNLKPVVASIRFMLRPLHRLVPREFHEWIGEREVLVILVILITVAVRIIGSVMDSSTRRSTMVNLCKYAEMSEKLKIVETENDKLKKSTLDSDKYSMDIQKERDLKEAKIYELRCLTDENQGLKDSNTFLEEEITKLKHQISGLSQMDKDTKNLLKKIDDLNQLNEAVDRQMNEFRSSFEREREKNENLETKFTNEKEIVKKLQSENQKYRQEAKDLSTKLNDLSERNLKLDTDLEETRKELDGLKVLVANCETSKLLDGATDSNGSGWDLGDSGSEEESKKKMEIKMAEIGKSAKLQSELNSRQSELDQMKKVLKEMLEEKDSAVKRYETSKTENESLQKSLNDANEKTLTLQSKINVLRDFYEDQRKEMAKQLTTQQVLSVKQSTDLTSVEEETNKLREENILLRKTAEDLRSEVKSLDNLLSKARNELDRSRHEAWTSVRRLEREKDALKSDNSMLRTRLNDHQDKLSPGGSGSNAGDVSNNSSEAELGGLARGSSSFNPPPLSMMMPSYPPPPNVFSGHTSPFYPPPPPPGPYPYYPPRGSGRDSYDEYGYFSPIDSPGEDYPPEFRRSLRRPKSKTRSSPSRSPSPGKDRRARSRGGTTATGRKPQKL